MRSPYPRAEMTIRQFRPVTAGTRFRSVSGFDEVTRSEPERTLLEPLKRTGGRNNLGHMTIRARGGGHKRRYRRGDWGRGEVWPPRRVAGGGVRRPRAPPVGGVVRDRGGERPLLLPAAAGA